MLETKVIVKALASGITINAQDGNRIRFKKNWVGILILEPSRVGCSVIWDKAREKGVTTVSASQIDVIGLENNGRRHFWPEPEPEETPE